MAGLDPENSGVVSNAGGDSPAPARAALDAPDQLPFRPQGFRANRFWAGACPASVCRASLFPADLFCPNPGHPTTISP
jgi:hypothetical protein